MVLMVKFQEDNIMKNVTIFIVVLFSNLLNSQIKLNDKVIDSIIAKNSCQCFDFYFDKELSHITISESTKDEGIVPTKLSLLAGDINGLDTIMNSKKDYRYIVIYNYKFTIDNYVFYTSNFRYETSKHDIEIIRTIIENINSICLKIKQGKFIPPKEAENIAKKNGFNNITYQSIADQYFGVKNHYKKTIKKYVWIFKEENQKTRTLVVNAKNGKILSKLEE